jgi:uncharacterized membrane protein
VSDRALERRVARVLQDGTWAAASVIGVGLASGSVRVVTAGIIGLILLPVVRVTLMLAAYLGQRDYRLSAIAGLVLLFLALGFLTGLRTP